MEIVNRKARYDYIICDEYEAGIVLTGTEIKSIRMGKANLKDSYAIIRGDEIYLLNMHISSYEKGNLFNHDEDRTRKLLMHKAEIRKLNHRVLMDGYTLIPLKIYFVKGRAKVLIGVCKGKKNYDKRETIKKRDVEREMRREYKNR
ncbi:MAG: SsrA-binding protein SmpB [Erysipelotrichaceae bacterium]|nr:SsrA-binding protein SmpB [Erysipelotrichaceae bacterium]